MRFTQQAVFSKWWSVPAAIAVLVALEVYERWRNWRAATH